MTLKGSVKFVCYVIPTTVACTARQEKSTVHITVWLSGYASPAGRSDPDPGAGEKKNLAWLE